MAELSDNDLIRLAKEASKMAYAPYSGFPVGCALISVNGHVYSACNVENISFGLSICAERAAVCKGISEEGPQMKVRKVVIYTPTEQPVTPCGACRQVLYEFGDDITVISVCENGRTLSTSVSDLLPKAPAIKLQDDRKAD